MYKLLFIVVILGFAHASYAQDYSVRSEILVASEMVGSPHLIVTENTQASVAVNQHYTLSVNVSAADDNKVLLDFTYKGAGYETVSQVIFDLDKKATLTFDEQTFKFLISKVNT